MSMSHINDMVRPMKCTRTGCGDVIAALVRVDGGLWVERFEPDLARTRANVVLAALARRQGKPAPAKGKVPAVGWWVRDPYNPRRAHTAWCSSCGRTVMLR